MSTGAVSASQNSGITGSNASGIGQLGNQQSPLQQQQSIPQPAGLGSDKIYAPSEAMMLPLVAPDGPGLPGNSAAADSIVSSQVPGMLAIAILGGGIAVAAAAGIPLAIEMAGKRAKARLKIYGEQAIEHSLRNAHRSALDKSLDWIENLEKLAVRESYVKVIVADMRGTWDRLLTAHRNGDARAIAAETHHAEAIGLPVESLAPDARGQWFAKGQRLTGEFRTTEPNATHLASTAVHVHKHVGALENAKRADGDLKRHTDEQVRLSLLQFGGKNFTDIVDHLALNRTKRFRDKLTGIHKDAQAEFYRHVFVGGR